jgi:hypothetical protein
MPTKASTFQQARRTQNIFQDAEGTKRPFHSEDVPLHAVLKALESRESSKRHSQIPCSFAISYFGVPYANSLLKHPESRIYFIWYTLEQASIPSGPSPVHLPVPQKSMPNPSNIPLFTDLPNHISISVLDDIANNIPTRFMDLKNCFIFI